MKIDELRARKRELGYTNEQVAELSGVPLSTVQKVFGGTTASPRFATLRALERALFPERPVLSSAVEVSPEESADVHRFYAAQVFAQMALFQTANGRQDLLLQSPAVQLDSDGRAVVRPDIAVLCDRDNYRNGRVFGVPDFVLEVLTPSIAHALFRKLSKYWQAGVRECWIVDPTERVVTVYSFVEGFPPVEHSFDNPVPVGIWDGALCIAFPAFRDVTSILASREIFVEETTP